MVSEVVSQRTSGAPDAAVRCAEVYVMSTQLRVHERRQFRERGIVALARCASNRVIRCGSPPTLEAWASDLIGPARAVRSRRRISLTGIGPL
jgi:hypothetical protein